MLQRVSNTYKQPPAIHPWMLLFPCSICCQPHDNWLTSDFILCAADNMLWLDLVQFFATPHYTAPELVNLWCMYYGRGREVPQVLYDAAKADAWGVGAILYELATSVSLIEHGPGLTGALGPLPGMETLFHYLQLMDRCHNMRKVSTSLLTCREMMG